MIDAIPIIEDRLAGKTCREIAEARNIPEHQIWQLMRSTGYAGKIRGRPRARRPTPNLSTHDLITGVLAERTELVIERGAGGGYIATIDETTGREERDVQSAIRSAMRCL